MLKRLVKFSIAAVIVAAGCAGGNSVYAQSNQTTSGTTTGSTTNSGSTTTSGTTGTSSGSTTSAQQFGQRQADSTPGSNITDSFIGGNALDAFIGGGLETRRNRIRQFRAIMNNDVPTGGNRPANSTPRRIPNALRIAFQYPPSDAATRLNGPSGPAIYRVALVKPELRAVQVDMHRDGVAVLTGVVSTPAASRLATNLVRLRPGVRTVENQLSVTGP